MYKERIRRDPLWPDRGAPAGSRFADVALRIVLIEPMDGFVHRWPNCNLSVYIDDFTTQHFGRISDVKRHMVASSRSLKLAIEQADLNIAPDKGQLVATRKGHAVEIAQAMSKCPQCPPVVVGKSIRHLGADFSSGAVCYRNAFVAESHVILIGG